MMLDTSNAGSGRPAQLRFMSGSFHVATPGDHVLCAVTGRRIPLGSLRYWSHELQEAYVDAEVAVARYDEARVAGRL
jgi:hypothetical protein